MVSPGVVRTPPPVTPLCADKLPVESYSPVHSVRQIGLAVAATATAERAQLIGQVNMARHGNCETHPRC